MAVFSQKKSPEPSIPAPATSAVANQSSLIGNTLLIKGEVFSDDEILIEGKVQGSITVKNRLVIGVNGNVEAEINAREVVIKGRVTGNVKGSQRVEIVPSGVLHGNINAPRVVIADSGIFEGNIEMHGRDEKGKGREDAPAAQSQKGTSEDAQPHKGTGEATQPHKGTGEATQPADAGEHHSPYLKSKK